MVFRRPGRSTWYVDLAMPGGRVRKSTGTTDRLTAKAVQRCVEDLVSRREFDLLNAVVNDRISLGELYDAHRDRTLDALRAKLDDVDLAVYVDGWQKWLTDRVGKVSRDRYLVHVRTLIPDGRAFPRSALTGPAVAQWLATRPSLTRKRRPAKKGSRRKEDPAPVPASGPTKRRYLAAVRNFTRYLVEIGVLAANPLRDVQAPPPNAPRCTFLELPDVIRLVRGSPPPYRALFALAYGAGLEVSAVLSLVETDVDVQAKEVRARGTKAWTRDRLARIADWAWPYVETHLKTLTPGERLFRGMHRWQVSDMHRERCRVIELEGYHLHDARHHWAVRMVRAGMPLELVARQLGHRDVVMVAKVYGRFVPTTVERDRWEAAAAALDKAKWKQLDTEIPADTKSEGALYHSVYHAPSAENDKSRKPVGPRDLGSSRGGTRTRDPGIMSAVL